MSNTEIVDLVVDAALVVAWIAVVVLPLLPLARKTARIEKLTVKADTVASADREGRTNGVIDDEHTRDQSLPRIEHKHTLMRRSGYHTEKRPSDISPIAEENPTSDDLGNAT
jgi:hypothetical protein